MTMLMLCHQVVNFSRIFSAQNFMWFNDCVICMPIHEQLKCKLYTVQVHVHMYYKMLKYIGPRKYQVGMIHKLFFHYPNM